MKYLLPSSLFYFKYYLNNKFYPFQKKKWRKNKIKFNNLYPSLKENDI